MRVDLADGTTMLSFDAAASGWHVGFATYVVIVGAALAGWLPFEIMDRLGLCQGYRIGASNVVETAPEKARLRALAERMVARNLALLLPLSLCGGPVLAALLPFDSSGAWLSSSLLWQLPLFFLVDDICFYAYHRSLHTHPVWYRKYHKPHHEFKQVFGIVSHATHPVEMLLQSVGAMLGPLLLGVPRQTFWLWLVLRQWQGIEDHCGYEFPFSLSCLWPTAFGGAPFHDLHHSKNCGNFASVFPFIDRAFGTEIKIKAR